MRMPMPRSSGQVARSGFTGGGLSAHREREHEHAARLPQTGHGELARAGEAPGRGERLELLLGPAALHGEHPAVRGDEPPHLREELRQRCERARDDRVEGLPGVHRLDPRLKRRHVGEPERLRHVRHEADFLGRGVYEGEMPRGICDRKRQPRKPGAGTHVRNARAVQLALDGEAVEQVLRTEPFALVLLDLGLPGRDGLTLLKVLRERGLTAPVLTITARDAVSDRVQGLDAGADDYLTKPFDLDELAARIRALLRRKAGRSAPSIEYLGV